jgi:hypothetical protein
MPQRRALMRASCWLTERNVLAWTWLRLDTPERLPIQDQHVMAGRLAIAFGVSALAKADISGRSCHLIPRVIGTTTTLLINSYSDISYPHPLRRNDINHELLHLSRILDARANWCVYKSICQLPLDCYLRQPASDRGKCLRSHLIHRITSEKSKEGARATRNRITNTRYRGGFICDHHHNTRERR